MPSETVAAVKAFWEARARNSDLPAIAVTHPDWNQRLLELDVVLQYLPRGQRVLDVGCGNGFSTAMFARYASAVLGIDYSQEMIKRAQQEVGHLTNVAFQCVDVVNLDLPSASFDVAVSQRCLINLRDWESQKKAIGNIAQVVRPGGHFFLQEGTRQGRERLNQAREMLGLSRMPDVPFNLDMDEENLWPFVRQYFDIVEVRRFGLYDLISRIVHPLLVSPAEPKYSAKINEIARQVSAKLSGADDLGREFSAFLRRLDE